MSYSGIIIESYDGEFLFNLRSKNDDLYPNKWNIFGGHLKKGELPITGLKRELGEELKLKLKVEPELIMKVFLPWGKYFIYHTTIGKNTRMRVSKSQKMDWFSRKESIIGRKIAFPARIMMLFYPLINFFYNNA